MGMTLRCNVGHPGAGLCDRMDTAAMYWDRDQWNKTIFF